MFLLGISEILEEWTQKKAVDDLARSMALNVDQVWVVTETEEMSSCRSASFKAVNAFASGWAA